MLLAALACTVTGIILLQSPRPAMAQKKSQMREHRPEPRNQQAAAAKIYNSVDQMPEPPFDLGIYLAKNIKYPESAKKNEITGRVVAKFVVDASGKLRDIEIVKPLTPDCAAEVVRVLKTMPVWKPGMQDGKAVNVYFTLPVSFQLK